MFILCSVKYVACVACALEIELIWSFPLSSSPLKTTLDLKRLPESHIMAVNAVVIRNGIPVPVSRENFLHMEEGLSIEIGDNQYKGKGKVYLTNHRLIFLKRDPSREFSSFSLPFAFILKQKYSKKLLGGPVISGAAKPITNGGVDQTDSCKWSLMFNDTNTGKAFYNLLEKELAKINDINVNSDRFKRVTNTPSLPIEQIFPDQFAQYQQQQKQRNRQSQIYIKNQDKIHDKQVIVGQSHADAPMALTADHRAQKAKLFASSNSNVNTGPIHGASPVNVRAFSQRRLGKTMIQDDCAKFEEQVVVSNDDQKR